MSAIQNEAVTVQSNLTRAYNQSISSIKTENTELQNQLATAQSQLSSLPDIAEDQRLFVQSQDRVRTLTDQISILQTQLSQVKPAVVEVYK